MQRCHNCGKYLDRIPYRCHQCNYLFCSDCRLPENHGCKSYPPKPSSYFPKKKVILSKPFLKQKRSGIIEELIILSVIIVSFGWIFSNFGFPFILQGVHPNMQLVLGNPKSVYFYDISPSCDDNNIVSSLNHLSKVSGIQFIRIPPPFALLFGGIEYSCGGVQSIGASGESESGQFAASFIVITWDNIRLLNLSDEVIIHETLHSLGFAHSTNPNNIMYPVGGGNSQLDPDTIDFLKTYYVNNPFAYLNILTINMVFGGFFCLLIVVGIATTFSPKHR